MQPAAQAIIEKQISIMPPKVREALLHIDSSKYIQALAAKHQLRVDQGGVLEEEAMLIMLGLESPSMFMNNLVHRGRIPPSVASAIVADINRDVFEKIRHDLAEFLERSEKRFSGEESGEAGLQPPAAVIPPQKQPPQPTATVPGTPVVQKNTAPMPNTGFAKEKMEGAFRIPAETTRTGEAAAQAPSAKPPYTGADPYREPVK